MTVSMSNSLSRLGEWMTGRKRKAADVEKRYWPRIPAHERVVIFWRDDRGDDIEQAAQVLDVSEGGLAVRMDVEVPLGKDIRVRSQELVRSAVVRHVRADGADYVLGLEAS